MKAPARAEARRRHRQARESRPAPPGPADERPCDDAQRGRLAWPGAVAAGGGRTVNGSQVITGTAPAEGGGDGETRAAPTLDGAPDGAR